MNFRSVGDTYLLYKYALRPDGNMFSEVAALRFLMRFSSFFVMYMLVFVQCWYQLWDAFGIMFGSNFELWGVRRSPK